MKKNDSLNQVAAFHTMFGHPVLSEPTIPTPDRCQLRVSLIEEELDELKQAINQNDIVEVADALCDLQYVLSGFVLECGLGEAFKNLFEEVHRSNMSKACTTEEEAQQTVKFFEQEKNTQASYKKKDGKYLVFRKKDGKTLKSVNYSMADLKKIINNNRTLNDE